MWETVALAVTLAFITGFALTMIPLMRAGMPLRQVLGIAFAADFISVSVMEIIDNAVMMAIPGAMASGPLDWFFWASMALALAIAFAAALPVNLWLIRRGKGHAVVHAHHGGH
jgi:Sec-independent protein secretion pathway component TatC